jgi:hypothetical protein
METFSCNQTGRYEDQSAKSRRARVVDVVLLVVQQATFRLNASMGFSLLGVPLKYSRVVQAGAGYCGSRSICWVYGIIGSVQAQLK